MKTCVTHVKKPCRFVPPYPMPVFANMPIVKSILQPEWPQDGKGEDDFHARLRLFIAYHSCREAMPVERKYDATYTFGNTTVHVVAPPPMTEEAVDRVLDELHAAGWAILDELEEKAG